MTSNIAAPDRRSWRRSPWLWAVVVVIAGVVVLRLALPGLLLPRINEQLATLSPTYSLHIGRLHLSIFRMAYRFEDIEGKFKKDGHTFLTIDSVDVSIAWRELFRARVLTDVVADDGRIILSKKLIEGSNTPEAQPKDDAKQVADKLFPFHLARLELRRSSVEFADLLGEPAAERWRVSDIAGEILNVTPTPRLPETFFLLKGTMLKSALFKLAGKARRLEKPMAWKTDLELRDFNLVAANPMLLRELPLTFTAGHLDLFAEVRSQKGRLQGYVKPFLKNVTVISRQEHFVGVKHFAVELVTAAANLILRKSDDKTVAAKLPFHQDPGGPFKTDAVEAIVTAVQHGFSEPIQKGVEDSLDLE